MWSLKLLLVYSHRTCAVQRACFLISICVRRCSFSKETAVPFVTTAGSQNGLFLFFQVLGSCKEDSSGASLGGTPVNGLISGFPWRSCWFYPVSLLAQRLSVLDSALGHGRLMELSFEVCSSSRAGAQGQMHGKTAVFFARRYGDRGKWWQ